MERESVFEVPHWANGDPNAMRSKRGKIITKVPFQTWHIMQASSLDSASPSKVPRNLIKEGSPSAIYMVNLTSLASSEPLYQPDRDSMEGRLSVPRDTSRF